MLFVVEREESHEIIGFYHKHTEFKSAVCLGLFGAELTCDVRGSSYVCILYFTYKPKSLDGKKVKSQIYFLKLWIFQVQGA